MGVILTERIGEVAKGLLKMKRGRAYTIRPGRGLLRVFGMPQKEAIKLSAVVESFARSTQIARPC